MASSGSYLNSYRENIGEKKAAWVIVHSSSYKFLTHLTWKTSVWSLYHPLLLTMYSYRLFYLILSTSGVIFFSLFCPIGHKKRLMKTQQRLSSMSKTIKLGSTGGKILLVKLQVCMQTYRYRYYSIVYVITN
jgi:hypothetical protein